MLGFYPETVIDGHVPPWEYLPASAIQPKVGMALVLSSGKLAIATGTSKPEFICMAEHPAAVTAGTIVPVIRVTPEIMFKTSNSASLSGVAVGAKVTLHASSGMQVTATTSSGVAEIIAKSGDAAGSDVYVRFS